MAASVFPGRSRAEPGSFLQGSSGDGYGHSGLPCTTTGGTGRNLFMYRVLSRTVGGKNHGGLVEAPRCSRSISWGSRSSRSYLLPASFLDRFPRFENDQEIPFNYHIFRAECALQCPPRHSSRSWLSSTPYPRLPRLADVRFLRILRQKQRFKALKLVGHSPSWFKNMKGEGTPPPGKPRNGLI